MKKKVALVISCEHAVNTIPALYQPLFTPFSHLLSTHRGIDFGALEIALHLKEAIVCDFAQANTSRLLIDCNRSLRHAHCFSEATKNLSHEEKQTIINQYYLPYRQQIIGYIDNHIAQGRQVWHLSIHSFTPEMNQIVRRADIGFLYDPRRSAEKKIAKEWRFEIKKMAPQYTVRMNYPYNGISDGFTTALRKKYAHDQYLGMEIETNQALTYDAHDLDNLKNILTLSLLKIIC